jgi:hypothetical protein
MIKKTKLGLLIGALLSTGFTYAQTDSEPRILPAKLQDDDLMNLQNTLWFAEQYDTGIQIGTLDANGTVPMAFTQKIGGYCVPIPQLPINETLIHYGKTQEKLNPYRFAEVNAMPCEPLPKAYNNPEKSDTTVADYQFLLNLYKEDLKTHFAFTPKTMDWDSYQIQETSKVPLEDFKTQIRHILEAFYDCHSHFRLSQDETISACILGGYSVEQRDKVEAAFKQAKKTAFEQAKELSLLQGTATLSSFEADFVQSKLGQALQGKKIGHLNVTDFNKNYENRDLDELIAALDKTDALVIDVRVNDGGSDISAIALAERFMDWTHIQQSRENEIDFVTVKTFKNGVLSHGTPYVVQKTTSAHYHKPVIVLTSPFTFSAGDQFVVAMKHLVPNAVLVGRKTPSFYADLFYRVLPNGMSYTMSNENFHLNGVSLERNEQNEPKGIVPDYVTDDSKLERYYAQDNPSLNKALELIKERFMAQ